jgi:hypothetical protein
MDSNIPVTDEIIKIKARDYYGPLFNIDPNFKYSNGYKTLKNAIIYHYELFVVNLNQLKKKLWIEIVS